MFIYKDMHHMTSEAILQRDEYKNIAHTHTYYTLHLKILTISPCFGAALSLMSGCLSILSRKGTLCSGAGGRDGTK